MIKSTNKRATALFGAVALVLVSTTMASAANCSYVFTKTLKTGSTGAEVMNLQKVLNMSAGTTVSASGAGSAGNETMTFGGATRAAVIKFQAANSVSPTSGLVGPLTRAKLNAMCTGTGTTTPTTPGQTGPVSVMSASSQPSGAIVAGQSGALLGNFVVSGNGTVSSLKFMRTGVSTNDTLVNVYLYEGASRLTDSASVSSDGTISFNNVNMSVNGSRTISVRADIAAGTNGQIVGVKATSVMVTGTSSMTSVSAAGPMLTVAQVTNLASVTLNNQKGIANTSLTLPQLNYTLYGNDLNVGQRAVNLKSLTVKMIGSAPVGAVTNVALFVDGSQVATASADSNQRFVFDLTSAPKSLSTGSHSIEVRGNVVAGASRNFYFTAENVADMMFEDSSLAGVNITPVAFSTYRTAGTQTISGTSATSIVVAKDTTFTETNLVGGVSNTAISKFKVTAYGEDTKIQSITILPKVNAAASALISNVALFVNGSQVGNTNNTGAGYTFTLGSNFITTAGVASNLEVRADVRDRVSGLNFVNGTVLTADVIAMEGQGQSSQNTFNNVLAVAGQNLTVGGTVVNVGKTISGVATSISPNSTAVKIGSFQIQAGSIEAINVRQLTLGLVLSNLASQNLVSNVTLKDAAGVVLGTPTGISSASQNFNVNFDVNKGATTKVDVFADIAGMAVLETITPNLSVNYTGKTSNQTATAPVVAAPGDVVAINTTTVGVPTISSRLSSQYVLGGQNAVVGTYNVTSTNGKSTINDLTFTVSPATNGVESVTINGVTANPIGTTVTFSALNIAIPNGSAGVNVPVTVKFTPAFVGALGQPGVVSGTTGAITLTGMKSTTESGTVAVTTPSVATNLMTLVATLPTVTKASTGTSVGVNGATQLAVKIGSIRVAADAAGDIILGTLSYNLSAPAAISNVTVKVGGTVAQDKLSANSTNTVTTAQFAAGYRITAGTSVVFDIFGDIAAVTNSGTADISVGSAAAFLWSDDVATAGLNRAGTLLPSTKYVQ